MTSDSEEARKRQRARQKRKAAKKALAAKKAKALSVSGRVSLHPDRDRLRELETKLAGLQRKQAALQAEIAPLTVRSVKKAGLLVLPTENVLALRKLRPIETNLAQRIERLAVHYRAAYRKVHGGDPPS